MQRNLEPVTEIHYLIAVLHFKNFAIPPKIWLIMLTDGEFCDYIQRASWNEPRVGFWRLYTVCRPSLSSDRRPSAFSRSRSPPVLGYSTTPCKQHCNIADDLCLPIHRRNQYSPVTVSFKLLPFFCLTCLFFRSIFQARTGRHKTSKGRAVIDRQIIEGLIKAFTPKIWFLKNRRKSERAMAVSYWSCYCPTYYWLWLAH